MDALFHIFPCTTMSQTNQQIDQRRQAAAPRGVGVMCDFYADRAENATLWDVEGRAFTDFAAMPRAACRIAPVETPADTGDMADDPAPDPAPDPTQQSSSSKGSDHVQG